MAVCARDIAGCVQALHGRLLTASEEWSECDSDGTVLPRAAALISTVLDPVYDTHGFSAAHWCSFYVASAMGKLKHSCTGDCKGGSGACEHPGLASPMIGLAPCVCASLTGRFGAPPIKDGANVDLHPWGIYLAERLLAKARASRRAVAWAEVSDVLQLVKQHMVGPVDEEPLHGFLWRTVAADPTLSGVTHVRGLLII